MCRGVAARHYVCNNLPCERGGLTRSEQCSLFDREGEHWVVSYNSTQRDEHKCVLTCTQGIVNRWQTESVTKAMGIVWDGTDCWPRDRHTVCVQGQCQVR